MSTEYQIVRGEGVGINVPNEAGRMLPVLDGRTGAPLDLTTEINVLGTQDQARQFIERVARGCGVESPEAQRRPRPHQEAYFTW